MTDSPHTSVLLHHEKPISTLAITRRHVVMTDDPIPTQFHAHSITLMSLQSNRWVFRQTQRQLERLPDVSTTRQVGIAVSDGSMKYGKGAYAEIFADDLMTTTYEITGSISGRVNGNPGTITSFRSEAQGEASVFL